MLDDVVRFAVRAVRTRGDIMTDRRTQQPKKVEFEINLTSILAIVSVLGVIIGISRWIAVAEKTHESVTKHDESLNKISEIVDELHDQQKLERELWGDSYRRKIKKILEKDSEN